MGFSLFKKQQPGPGMASIPAIAAEIAAAAAGADPAFHQQRGAASCFFGPCTRTEGWQCTYTDARGNVCMSWWCQDHVAFIHGAPFCRRHAPLARMLVERVGSLYQMPVPGVHDRALPLLIRLTDQLDEQLVKLLRHLYSDNAQVKVAEHAMIRERKEMGAPPAWESVWTATAPTGYVTTFSLRVTTAEPPVVQLFRDGYMIEEAVPTWIAHRDEDAWHQPGDVEFVNHLNSRLIATFSGAAAGN